MPRGGARRGAGRKKGSKAIRRGPTVADTVVEAGRTPLSYMLRIMEDVTAAPARRDEMAKAAAVYCHPKLSSITTSNTSVNFQADANPTVQIFAVPRGARIERDGTALTIDGEAAELRPIEPFVGTPPLMIERDHNLQRVEPERESFEVIEIEPPQNVTVLNPHGRRQRDDDPDAT